jgi:autophagy-related protein 33
MQHENEKRPLTRIRQGVSYTLSNISLPALLHLPTAPLAQATHAATRARARRAQRALAAAAATAFSAAYLLSPRRAKHPYLLYCAVLAGAGTYCDGSGAVAGLWARIVGGGGERDGAADKGKGKGLRQRRSDEGLGESGVMVGQSSSASEADEEDAEGVNGEVVRRAVEEGVRAERVRMGVWGVGFFFSVLGIWGDLL